MSPKSEPNDDERLESSLESALRHFYTDAAIDAPVLTDCLRQAWARATYKNGPFPKIDDTELRRLLARGELTRKDLGRVQTPKYVTDLYEPLSSPPRVAIEKETQPRHGLVLSPFAMLPATPVYLRPDEPLPRRIAKCLKTIAQDFVVCIEARRDEAEVEAAAHGIEVRPFSTTSPVVFCKQEGPILEFFAYLHLVNR